MTTLIYYSDPLAVEDVIGHHNAVKEFVKDLAIQQNIEFVAGYIAKSRRVNRNKPNFYLIIQESVDQFFVVMREILELKKIQATMKIYVNTNVDLVWLISAIFFRIILRSPFSLRVRLIHTRDRRITEPRSLSSTLFRFLYRFFKPNDYLACETSIYATFLSRMLNQVIQTLPHPPILLKNGVSRVRGSSHVRVSFLGAGRKDKGFSELPNLIKEINETSSEIWFTLQAICDDIPDEDFLFTLKLLDNFSNVNIINGPLPNQDFEILLQNTDILLAPYDEGIYKYRGSSLVQTSHYLGILVFTYAETSMYKSASPRELVFSNCSDLSQSLSRIRDLSDDVFDGLQRRSEEEWRKFFCR